jgi:hypothetical protein
MQQAPPPRFQFQPGPPLQRSNSAPDLRVLLAGPLNPIPQAAMQGGSAFPFGGLSSSTAGALVPYKAPEVRGRCWQPPAPVVQKSRACTAHARASPDGISCEEEGEQGDAGTAVVWHAGQLVMTRLLLQGNMLY